MYASELGCDHLRRDCRIELAVAWPRAHQRRQHKLLEFRAEPRHQPLRIGTEAAIRYDAKLHVVVVGDDGNAHADVTGLRHPEHEALDATAGEKERRLR